MWAQRYLQYYPAQPTAVILDGVVTQVSLVLPLSHAFLPSGIPGLVDAPLLRLPARSCVVLLLCAQQGPTFRRFTFDYWTKNQNLYARFSLLRGCSLGLARRW